MKGGVFNAETIMEILNQKPYIREMLNACTSCGLCAESCFYYKNSGDRESVPSYKVRNTVGRLFRKKGRVKPEELRGMASLLWGRCALCRQCYCPVGIDLSSIMALGRSVCRSMNIDGAVGVYED